jgi:DNA repair protein RecO (recombination protein O)
VSRGAGEPWQDRMLRLPAFLRAEWEAGEPATGELSDAFALTGFFLERHVLEPRGLPMHDARASFINAVLRAGARAAS